MTSLLSAWTESTCYLRAGAPALGLLLLTSIHHAYGAVVYHTLWRMHVAVIAVPIALLLTFLLNTDNRSWLRAAAILILIVPVLAIGMFEGGYNHVVKDVLYFVAGPDVARSMFSGSAYEMPDDAFFEITGILQFFLGFWTAAGACKLRRTTSR